jgi:hypothetical protein
MEKKKLKKDNFEVSPIENKIAEEWIKLKHYSHRVPNMIYSFGLFNKRKLVGVITFGVSNTPHNEMLSGNLSVGKVLELNRVVILDNAPLNSASYMIAKTLKWLKQYSDYKVIISYADTAWNHSGYIYQASNFLYTGISKGSKKKTLLGKHPRTVRKDMENQEKEIIETSDKHRYIKFIGNKKENEEFLKFLKYRVMAYPKDIKKPLRYKTPSLKEAQTKLL